MNLVDANVLLYAVNESDERHEGARSWLDASLSGSATVGFAWLPLLAFLRLSTKPGLFPSPLSVDQALGRVRRWLEQPTSTVLEPTTRHFDVLAGLLTEVGAGGNLTSDAHLATLAVEHGATLVSYDNDFDRFRGLTWRTPETA